LDAGGGKTEKGFKAWYRSRVEEVKAEGGDDDCMIVWCRRCRYLLSSKLAV